MRLPSVLIVVAVTCLGTPAAAMSVEELAVDDIHKGVVTGEVDGLGWCGVGQGHAARLVCAPPVAGRVHPACRLALPAFHAHTESR